MTPDGKTGTIAFFLRVLLRASLEAPMWQVRSIQNCVDPLAIPAQ